VSYPLLASSLDGHRLLRVRHESLTLELLLKALSIAYLGLNNPLQAKMVVAGDKFSVILPTYNERRNLPIICWLIEKTFREK
jgi:hypothetical protein